MNRPTVLMTMTVLID